MNPRRTAEFPPPDPRSHIVGALKKDTLVRIAADGHDVFPDKAPEQFINKAPRKKTPRPPGGSTNR
ncbi:MAG: hypothetical protein H7330_14925 [Hymenobacteraceae bacterium]|nr:hypothetical protein [Hymenobacteraceae bacterium]